MILVTSPLLRSSSRSELCTYIYSLNVHSSQRGQAEARFVGGRGVPRPHRVREGMILILCLLHNRRRKPHPLAWREALPTGLTLLSFPGPSP